MVSNFCFAATLLGFVALSSGTLLRKPVVVHEPAWGDVMNSLMAFDSTGTADKELAGVEDTIEKLMTKGDDEETKLAVKQINDLITNTLIPHKMSSHKTDQIMLDKQFKDLQSCHLRKLKKRDMNVAAKLDTVAGHKDDFKDQTAKQGMCYEILDGKAMVKDAYCSSVKDVKTTCGCDERLGPILAPACDKAPKISSEDSKCCDAYYEHAKHETDCQTASYDAQYAEKQHSIIMSKLCDAYDTCYDNKLKIYENSAKLAKEHEALRAWPMLYKVQCIVSGFTDKKVSDEEIKACKEKKYEVKSIEYAVPAKEQCKVELR